MDVYHISTCIHLFIYKNINVCIYKHVKYVYVRASNDTTKSTRMATDKHIASCEGRYTLDNYHLQTGWSGRIKCLLYTSTYFKGPPVAGGATDEACARF